LKGGGEAGRAVIAMAQETAVDRRSAAFARSPVPRLIVTFVRRLGTGVLASAGGRLLPPQDRNHCSLIRHVTAHQPRPRLLAQPKVTLAEMAYCCGFASQSRSAAVFKKNVGTTAGRYRRSEIL